MISIQPQDEWKREQGLAGAELPIRDQTLPEGQYIKDVLTDDDATDEDDAAKADDIAKEDYDPDVLFAEEREGWRG